MLIYVARRLLWAPVLLFFAGLFVFALGTVAPGDPAQLIAGQRADPDDIARVRERLGLNDPFMVRYLRYIGDALRGDFGESYRYRGRDVMELLLPKLRGVAGAEPGYIHRYFGDWSAGGLLDCDAPRHMEGSDGYHAGVVDLCVACIFHRAVLDTGICGLARFGAGCGMVRSVQHSGDTSCAHSGRAWRVRVHQVYARLCVGCVRAGVCPHGARQGDVQHDG